MRTDALTLTVTVFIALTGCTASDTLKLNDGRTIELPAEVDVRSWVHDNLPDVDMPAVVEACRAEKNKSPRIAELCGTSEHRNALIQM